MPCLLILDFKFPLTFLYKYTQLGIKTGLSLVFFPWCVADVPQTVANVYFDGVCLIPHMTAVCVGVFVQWQSLFSSW